MLLTDKQMDQLTRDDLKSLLAQSEGPCVSIYMPTHRLWNEAVQDPIRLKNLLREAEGKLTENGRRMPEVQALLAPARALLTGPDTFWRHQSDGLALLLAPSFFASYRLPIDFEPLTTVNSRFYVKPLLRFFTIEGHFYVLALNQGKVQLFQGTPHSFREVDLRDVPQSLEEAMRFDDFETHLDFHSSGAQGGGRRAVVFHGQGAAGDEANVKDNILRFFRELDNGVREVLAQETAPLVLAGVEFLRGLYREANHYRNLVTEGIDGNPAAFSQDELHQKAWALLEPHFQRHRREAAETYRQLAGTSSERAAGTLQDVVQAAYYRRVETLFTPIGRHAWGTFDPEQETVHLHETAELGDEDLLDTAVTHTLLNGGTVYTVEPDEMPAETPAAAILRF